MTRPTDKRVDKRGSALRARSEASMIARLRAARLSAAPAPKSDAELIAEAIAAGFDGTSHAASAACPSSRRATAPSGLSRAPSPSSPGRDCIDRMGAQKGQPFRNLSWALCPDLYVDTCKPHGLGRSSVRHFSA